MTVEVVVIECGAILSHQNCPPQLLCLLWIVCAWYGPWVNAGDTASVFDHNNLKNKAIHAIWRDIWKRTVEKSQTNATNLTIHPFGQAIKLGQLRFLDFGTHFKGKCHFHCPIYCLNPLVKIGKNSKNSNFTMNGISDEDHILSLFLVLLSHQPRLSPRSGFSRHLSDFQFWEFLEWETTVYFWNFLEV